MKCPACGQWFDVRDLWQVAEHSTTTARLKYRVGAVAKRISRVTLRVRELKWQSDLGDFSLMPSSGPGALFRRSGNDSQQHRVVQIGPPTPGGLARFRPNPLPLPEAEPCAHGVQPSNAKRVPDLSQHRHGRVGIPTMGWSDKVGIRYCSSRPIRNGARLTPIRSKTLKAKCVKADDEAAHCVIDPDRIAADGRLRTFRQNSHFPSKRHIRVRPARLAGLSRLYLRRDRQE